MCDSHDLMYKINGIHSPFSRQELKDKTINLYLNLQKHEMKIWLGIIICNYRTTFHQPLPSTSIQLRQTQSQFTAS
jgi:hypothetical protein